RPAPGARTLAGPAASPPADQPQPLTGGASLPPRGQPFNGCRNQSTTRRRGTSSPPAALGSPQRRHSREKPAESAKLGEEEKGGAFNVGGWFCAGSRRGVGAIVLRCRLLCLTERPRTRRRSPAVWSLRAGRALFNAISGAGKTLRMESKPSRIPRRISVQPSSSLSARMMSGSRGSSLNDTYHSRDSSFRLDSEYQVTSCSLPKV
uniref:Membrane associated ring-CH-type finger 7 n=1 Tax=Equus asinus TaxID=9793 RepID=A0A9L0K1U6_EQUAS